MNWDVIIAFVSGSGIAAAIINGWFRMKTKAMDLALQERKQFVTEINDLRKEINSVSQKLNDVVRENGELKVRVAELASHIDHKSGKLNKLKKLVEEYNNSIDNESQEIFIKKVIELAS